MKFCICENHFLPCNFPSLLFLSVPSMFIPAGETNLNGLVAHLLTSEFQLETNPPVNM